MNRFVARTAAQLAQAHPEIPPERRERLVGRTLLGALFVGLGAAILGALVLVPAILVWRSGNLDGFSVPLLLVGLSFGVGLSVLGATVWSTQLVSAPLELVVATFRGLWEAVRGRAP